MSSGSPNANNSSSPFRVSYSNYVADITGNPRPTRPSATTGIGHHINPLHNPFPNQKTQSTQNTGGMPQYGGGSEKCARCSKTVYAAEKKVGASRSFHISCFNCNTCKRKLDSNTLSEHKGEIYCKPCYIKQFGGHGLISGVSMSTENTASRETRRPSRSDEIDSSSRTDQEIRRQTYTKESNSHDESIANENNRTPSRSPQRENNNTFQRQISPAKTSDEGINAIVDSKYQRSPSPSKGNNFNTNENRHRSTYIEEDDRSKYAYEGEKISYGGSGTSAIVDIPIINQNKPTNSVLDQFELPNESSRDRLGSRSPSVKSNDSYRRQDSRERTADQTNNYPFASTYEAQRQSSIHSNTSDRGLNHSREQSPFNSYRNRSPSPTTGYNAPSTTRTPPTSYVQQYSRHSNDIPSNYDERRSPSPQPNDRVSSGLADFIAKANITGPSSNEPKNSTLGALAGGFRPYGTPDNDLDD